MRFQWWPAVLLEWDRKSYSLKCKFLQIFTFFQLLFDGSLEKSYIDTNNNSPEILYKIVVKKDKVWFSYMLFLRS